MILDGKLAAKLLCEDIAKEVAKLKSDKSVVPGLAVILVGDDPASHVYVRNKGRQTVEAGMKSFEFRMPQDTSQEQLLSKIYELNDNPEVNGILVQMPLPKHLDENVVINAISPNKDVDGFHPVNVGLLSIGQAGALVPCTPQGCMILLEQVYGKDLSGRSAVVIGRSNIVGKPLASLLIKANCTVTVAHSRTANLPEVCRQADIVVAAVGKPGLVKKDWLKPSATVIDVGINRIEGSDGKSKLVGDVDFASVEHSVGAITPVPGGVGPMTIACLLRNTLIACQQQNRREC